MQHSASPRLLCISLRKYKLCSSSNYSSTAVMNIFDRKAKEHHRNRLIQLKDYQQYNYIKDEIGFRVFDRLCDVKRSFNTAIDLGCGLGHVTKNITKEQQLITGQIYMIEMAEKLLEHAKTSPNVSCTKIHIDEEHFTLHPFPKNSIDLIYSNLSLHWINNLPGLFKQALDVLKNDGVFIGSLFGSDTVYELRVALQLAETELLDGFAPHVSPFTAVRDLGDLLNRAGFSMITLDADEIVVNYPGILQLMRDLQGMGESNSSWKRPHTIRRDVIKRAEEIYRERYAADRTDGTIPATFCILSFIGWKPDPSQPQPLERGSATVSLKDLANFTTPPSTESS